MAGILYNAGSRAVSPARPPDHNPVRGRIMANEASTTSKVCSKCALVKSLDLYGIESRTHDGRRAYCRDCQGRITRDYRQRSPECRAARLAWQRGAKGRKIKLRYRYGIEAEEYDRLLKSQDGRCAICRTDRPGGRYNDKLLIDHDHATGKIRGLLCQRCNGALGLFGDDLAGIMRVVEYLKRR